MCTTNHPTVHHSDLVFNSKMSAPANSKPFPFLKLPVELRRKVYSELLVVEETILLFSDRPSLSSQILQTCHLVHDEGVKVLYGDNAFDLRRLSDSALKNKIGAHNVQHIRYLKESPRYGVEMFMHTLAHLGNSSEDPSVFLEGRNIFS